MNQHEQSKRILEGTASILRGMGQLGMAYGDHRAALVAERLVEMMMGLLAEMSEGERAAWEPDAMLLKLGSIPSRGIFRSG